MQDRQTIMEEIRALSSTLTAAERLQLIREIAAADFGNDAPNPRTADTLARQQQLAAEQEAWFVRPPSERRQYAQGYVAVYQKKVVDHDTDRRALYLRVRERFGSAPVLIVSSGLDEAPEFTVHSPRLG